MPSRTTAVGECAIVLSNCKPFELVQDPYVVVDLRAAFRIDRHWEAALSVNNVFDKIYYEAMAEAQLQSPHGWYGEPSNFMLRIDGRY